MRDYLHFTIKALLAATIGIAAFIGLGKSDEGALLVLGVRSLAIQACRSPAAYEELIAETAHAAAIRNGVAEFHERAERYRQVIEAEERLAALDQHTADAAVAELEWKRAQRHGEQSGSDASSDSSE